MSTLATIAPTQSRARSCYELLLNLSFRTHLLLSCIIRLALIIYGQVHDKNSEIPYTDIDYKVVTDGARQVLNGCSPFARHTYRYSPLLAYMQLPNILLHAAAGKIIYAFFDIIVAVLIYALVHAELQSQCRKAVQSLLCKFGSKIRTASGPVSTQQETNSSQSVQQRERTEKIARASACFWLYNPLTAIISTRGNGDSFSSFFVILTIYLLAKSDDVTRQRTRNFLIFAAGLSHGLAIHLRLYPLLFSLAYFLCLSESLARNIRSFMHQLLFPTNRQLLFVLGTAIGLLTTTGLFYQLYGWQYIYEAYLYHFVRKDARHNFSLYFLTQYLSEGVAAAADNTPIERIFVLGPQIFLLFYLSFSFGQFRQTLPFCIFTLALTLVTFNTVITSQYFIWYLSLLPLCLNNLQSISLRKALCFFMLWLAAQGLWLLPAYLLEFRTWNTFYWIGAQSAVFFLVNNFLLASLIEHYSFTSFKVNFKKLF